MNDDEKELLALFLLWMGARVFKDCFKCKIIPSDLTDGKNNKKRETGLEPDTLFVIDNL